MQNRSFTKRFYIKGFTKPEAHKCQRALGLEDGRLPDGAFSASSEYNGHYTASNARLHFHGAGSRKPVWLASSNNQNQWLQVCIYLMPLSLNLYLQ